MEENDDKVIVSVIVQTYNHGKYIRECLESLVRQNTTFKYEIIIGEDESNDQTREICISFAEKYPELIILNLRSRKDVIKIDGKVTGRYNLIKNIESVRGKYMAFCEGDDYWIDDNKLQMQVDFLESNPDYSICFHDCYLLTNGKLSNFKPEGFFKDTYTLEDTFRSWFIPSASMLFRLTPEFELPEWFSKVFSGDRSLIALVASYGKIKYLDRKMSVYRILHSGQLSSTSQFSRIKSTIFLLENLNNHFNFEYKSIIDKEIKKWMLAYILRNKVEALKLGFDLFIRKLKQLISGSRF